jgi:hypothetical protein
VEGLLSAQGLRMLDYACDACLNQPRKPINLWNKVRGTAPAALALQASLGGAVVWSGAAARITCVESTHNTQHTTRAQFVKQVVTFKRSPSQHATGTADVRLSVGKGRGPAALPRRVHGLQVETEVVRRGANQLLARLQYAVSLTASQLRAKRSQHWAYQLLFKCLKVRALLRWCICLHGGSMVAVGQHSYACTVPVAEVEYGRMTTHPFPATHPCPTHPCPPMHAPPSRAPCQLPPALRLARARPMQWLSSTLRQRLSKMSFTGLEVALELWLALTASPQVPASFLPALPLPVHACKCVGRFGQSHAAHTC